MASIEFIQKRIMGKEKELEKLTSKLARIKKAEAFDWADDHNPYLYNEYDLKYCLKDIEATQKALEDYKAKLASETEKANSRNVKVIIDFLEIWKSRVREYYMDGLRSYYKDQAEARAALNSTFKFPYASPEYNEAKAKCDEICGQFRIDCYGAYEKQEYIDHRGRTRTREVKVANGKYEYLRTYTDEKTLEGASGKLEKDLVLEANRKYDFIIERTNAIVGTITDASNLEVGAKDDLNGYIIGTKGSAKIQTIGAGGYNIQCFHFRTLINKIG